MDVDGSREPLVHFLSETDEIEASRITIQDGTTDGKSWKAELDIDESVAALEDKEGFFGFKITVFDKSGNERLVRFEDDGTGLSQIEPSGVDAFASVNQTGFRARFDTKHPEVEEIALTSTNSGENPDDFPNSA